LLPNLTRGVIADASGFLVQARRDVAFLLDETQYEREQPVYGTPAVRLRSVCAPTAIRLRSPRPPNIREPKRTPSAQVQHFGGFSPVFAELRGSLTNRGERLELAGRPSVCHRKQSFILDTTHRPVAFAA
jgi:hypothetical protein